MVRDELLGVGQVAVVAEADAERRVDVERLGLVRAVAAGRRVAHVADPGIAHELAHVLLAEHVAHEAGVLVHEQRVLVHRHDAGRVLAAMLQHASARRRCAG